jgi:O-antigen ligase
LLAGTDERSRPVTLRAWLSRLIDLLFGRAAVLLAGAVVLFGAMFFSGSRGAIVSLVLALVFVLGLGLATNGWRLRERKLLFPLVLGMLVAVGWFGTGLLSHRLADTLAGSTGEARLIQWRLSLEMFRDFWLTGSGAGTYRHVFAAYQTDALRDVIFDHAHNDYIEILCEQGVIGSVLLGLPVVLMVARVSRAYTRRRDPLLRSALFGSAVALWLLVIHAFMEFNFAIPANAVLFYVLLGIGLAAATLPRQRSARAGL